MVVTTGPQKKEKLFWLQNQLRKFFRMASNAFDPGGGVNPPTYARRARNVKFELLNRNVLNITLEKKIEQKNITMNGEEKNLN